MWEGSREVKLRIGELVHLECRGGNSKFVKVGRVRFQILLITRNHENSLCLKLQE